MIKNSKNVHTPHRMIAHVLGIALCFTVLTQAVGEAASSLQSRATAIVTLSSDTVEIGEQITARYELSGGSGEYARISCIWNIQDSATNCSYQEGYTELTESTGEVSFVPRFGDSLSFQIAGEDNNGIPFLATSAETKITGDVQYPVVTITMSSEFVAIGEAITACYELSGGSGEYARISGIWNIEDSATNCSYQEGYTMLTESTGEVSFVPRFGDSLSFQIEGEDSNGIPFLSVSEEIIISSVPVVSGRALYLPSSTQIIESEAFQGVPIDKVYIPNSVTFIAIDAFDPGVLLVLENDSLSEWATANGIDYIVGFDNAFLVP